MTLPSFSVNRRNRLQVSAMLPKVNGSSTNETMFSRHSSGKDKMDTAMIIVITPAPQQFLYFEECGKRKNGRMAMFLVMSPIVINVPPWLYCSVAGKFEYQKKYDVNEETSLFHGV